MNALKKYGSTFFGLCFGVFFVFSGSFSPDFIYGQTRQQVLEQHFDIIETFDNLNDFKYDLAPSQHWKSDGKPMPTKILGGDSNIVYYHVHDSWDSFTKSGNKDFWIKDHGSSNVWGGTGKSICMQYYAKEGGNEGPMRIGFYWGEGDHNTAPYTGYATDVYTFAMVKFPEAWDREVSAGFKWEPYSGGTDVYYLLKTDGSDPYLLYPSWIKVNGTAYDKAIDGENYGVFDPNNLSAGEFCWAEAPGESFYTAYIRLNETDKDPDNHTIQFHYTPFADKSDGSEFWRTYFKFLEILTGFSEDNFWGTDEQQADDALCSASKARIRQEYGLNYIIMQWYNSAGIATDMLPTFYARRAVPCEDPTQYEVEKYVEVNRGTGNIIPISLKSIIRNAEWFGLEYHWHIGTFETQDGYMEIFIYDSSGNVIGHHIDNNDGNFYKMKTVYDHKINKITWGGNRFSIRYGLENDQGDTGDARFYLDDIIINETRIGPTYFQIVNPPSAPIGLRIVQ